MLKVIKVNFVKEKGLNRQHVDDKCYGRVEFAAIAEFADFKASGGLFY